MCPRIHIALVVLLVAVPAAEVTACELDRAVARYWKDLVPGDLVQTETVVQGKDHRSRTVTTSEVTTSAAGPILSITEQMDADGEAGAGGEPAPKISIRSGSNYVMVPAAGGRPATLIETRWTIDRGHKTAPRQQTLEASAAANRLPGLPSYCVEEPPAGTETIETPAGRYACKKYRAGEAMVWIAPDLPLGGVVRTTASGPDENMESRLLRVTKGKR